MGINITGVLSRVYNLKKNLFFDTTTQEFSSVVFKNGEDIVDTLNTQFYVSKNTLDRLPGEREQRRMVISDAGESMNLDDVVPISTTVEYGGEAYKIKQYIRPRGLTRKYKLILEPTGETGG